MTDGFDAGADGRVFRGATFTDLARRYHSVIGGAVMILTDLRFDFPEMDKVHGEQMRHELLFRHALPFCVTEESFFEVRTSSSRVLAALLAGHTLALTNLDYHLDGGEPALDGPATARKVPLASAIAYAIRMIYAAGAIAETCGDATLFRDAFDPVSGFVIGRMYQDHADRYSSALLESAPYALVDYLESPTSRLLASGYWEVMVRGAFASHATEPPAALLDVVRALRKLRQLVDEVADFDEDISAGLVTSPLLFALRRAEHRPALLDAVGAVWRDAHDVAALARVRDLVLSADGFRGAADHADVVWRDARQECSDRLGTRSTGYALLLDLKRAKLAQLEQSGWRDARTKAVFT